MQRIYVWDLVVRAFHWSLALLYLAQIFIIDDDSDLHQYVGYVVMVLVLVRIMWGFIGSQYARFSSFPPSFQQSVEQAEEILRFKRNQHIGHTPIGALMIYNLLISIILLCLSGYWMTTDMFWGVEWPEEMHEFFVVWTEISVFLHICAVLFESHRTRVNLPKSMLTGYKNIDK